MKSTPRMARRTGTPTVWNVPAAIEPLKEKRETFVAGLATMILAETSPMKAMNRPMPADTARFRLMGIALKIASRTLVRDRIMKITPSRQTAARAVCQE